MSGWKTGLREGGGVEFYASTIGARSSLGYATTKSELIPPWEQV